MIRIRVIVDTDHRLRLRMRPNARDVVSELRNAAGEAGRGRFGHEADRQERGIRREPLVDDGLERVELGRPRPNPPRHPAAQPVFQLPLGQPNRVGCDLLGRWRLIGPRPEWGGAA